MAGLMARAGGGAEAVEAGESGVMGAQQDNKTTGLQDYGTTELKMDCGVMRDAAQKAAARVRQESPGHLEACAYELARFYNTFERMLERICDEFENHFDKRGDYHEKLLQRLSLSLEGFRPHFIPPEALNGLRELKGFRHLVRHAYDLTLRPDRLAELSDLADEIAGELQSWCIAFGKKVSSEQGWEV